MAPIKDTKVPEKGRTKSKAKDSAAALLESGQVSESALPVAEVAQSEPIVLVRLPRPHAEEQGVASPGKGSPFHSRSPRVRRDKRSRSRSRSFSPRRRSRSRSPRFRRSPRGRSRAKSHRGRRLSSSSDDSTPLGTCSTLDFNESSE